MGSQFLVHYFLWVYHLFVLLTKYKNEEPLTELLFSSIYFCINQELWRWIFVVETRCKNKYWGKYSCVDGSVFFYL